MSLKTPCRSRPRYAVPSLDERSSEPGWSLPKGGRWWLECSESESGTEKGAAVTVHLDFKRAGGVEGGARSSRCAWFTYSILKVAGHGTSLAD